MYQKGLYLSFGDGNVDNVEYHAHKTIKSKKKVERNVICVQEKAKMGVTMVLILVYKYHWCYLKFDGYD